MSNAQLRSAEGNELMKRNILTPPGLNKRGRGSAPITPFTLATMDESVISMCKRYFISFNRRHISRLDGKPPYSVHADGNWPRRHRLNDGGPTERRWNASACTYIVKFGSTILKSHRKPYGTDCS